MPRTVARTMVRSWSGELDALSERIAPRLARSEVRKRAQAYLRGLLASVERKNSWQLAEVAGDAKPYGLQHLLGRANWDADELRDDLREYVLERLGDEKAVLVVDETGFLKKGKERGQRKLRGEAPVHRYRSEERRVGKECRSRWSPYH